MGFIARICRSAGPSSGQDPERGLRTWKSVWAAAGGGLGYRHERHEAPRPPPPGCGAAGALEGRRRAQGLARPAGGSGAAPRRLAPPLPGQDAAAAEAGHHGRGGGRSSASAPRPRRPSCPQGGNTGLCRRRHAPSRAATRSCCQPGAHEPRARHRRRQQHDHGGGRLHPRSRCRRRRRRPTGCSP